MVTNWLQINDFESSESQYSEDITIRTDDIVDEQLFKFKDQRRLSGSITDKGRQKLVPKRGKVVRLSIQHSKIHFKDFFLDFYFHHNFINV